MENIEHTYDRATKRIRWIARIWSAVIIAFALMILIGYTTNRVTTGTADPHAEEDYPFIENLPPIFMFLAIIGLGIAWRFEKIGGIINLFFCSAIIPLLLFYRPITIDSSFTFPFILVILIAFPGILFLGCWWRSRKRMISQNGT
jgi:hypothetical protein